MSDENDAPSSERAGKGSGQAVDPPQIKNFSIQLKWHLRYGTRPEGQPQQPGKEWDLEEFATAIQNSRTRRRVKSSRRHRSNLAEGSARTNLNNWLSGIRCQDISWAIAIETTLFGANRAFDTWRVQLREARIARPQEAETQVPVPPESGDTTNDITHAKLDAIHDKIELLIAQARPQGVAEEAIRAIAAKISTTLHNAPIEDILLYIENFVESAKIEKEKRKQHSNEIADLAALRAAAGKLLDAGQLEKVSLPFDVELRRRRSARAERIAEETHEEIRLLEEAADYDRLAFMTDRAIERYSEAAVLFSPGNTAKEADYLQEKAFALSRAGEVRGDSAALVVSIGLWRNLLARSEGFPSRFEWAFRQANLGNALQSLGELERGIERLEQAVTAHRDALKVLSSERALFQWSVTQRVPFSLFGVKSEEAASSNDLLNLLWARTQINLGNSIRTLADREGNTALLHDAVLAFQEALQVLTRERTPDEWAGAQHSLGLVLEVIGDIEQLKQAIAAYREALKVFTPKYKVRHWAILQNSLGTALMALADYEDDSGKLEQAVEIFRTVLKKIKREDMPFDWARTQHNLGRAVHTYGERTCAAESLRQAVSAYREALREFSPKHSPHQWTVTKRNLASAEKLLAGLRK